MMVWPGPSIHSPIMRIGEWMDGWMDGWMGGWMDRRVRLAKNSVSGQKLRDQTPPIPTPRGTYYVLEARTGTDTHAYTQYMHNPCTHAHAHDHKSSRAQVGQALWHWFVFLNPSLPPHPSHFPFFSSPELHPLLGSLLAHHRAILLASGEGAKGATVEAYLERWREAREGGRERGGGTISWQQTMECLAAASWPAHRSAAARINMNHNQYLHSTLTHRCLQKHAETLSCE